MTRLAFLPRLLLAAALVAAKPADGRADLSRGMELFSKGRFEEAARELEGPAAAGEPAALYVLGILYRDGIVETPEGVDPVALIARAGEAGYLPAQTELARMYQTGDGVAQDFAKMMIWYRRAAEQGDVGAQLLVADGYAYGLGVPEDPVEAYMWYEIAIRYWGALAVAARDVLAERMTKEQIAEAVRRAADWLAAHPDPAQ